MKRSRRGRRTSPSEVGSPETSTRPRSASVALSYQRTLKSLSASASRFPSALSALASGVASGTITPCARIMPISRRSMACGSFRPPRSCSSRLSSSGTRAAKPWPSCIRRSAASRRPAHRRSFACVALSFARLAFASARTALASARRHCWVVATRPATSAPSASSTAAASLGSRSAQRPTRCAGPNGRACTGRPSTKRARSSARARALA